MKISISSTTRQLDDEGGAMLILSFRMETTNQDALAKVETAIRKAIAPDAEEEDKRKMGFA